MQALHALAAHVPDATELLASDVLAGEIRALERVSGVVLHQPSADESCCERLLGRRLGSDLSTTRDSHCRRCAAQESNEGGDGRGGSEVLEQRLRHPDCDD